MVEGESGWRSFTVTQTVTTDPPGFVWDAVVAMAPLVTARAVDAYHDGRGTLRATVFGVSVVSAPDTPAMAEGELLCYLAEGPWAPAALSPASGVEWAAANDETPRATLTDGAVEATLTFRFSPDGLVRSVSERRYRQEAGNETPWVGRFGS